MTAAVLGLFPSGSRLDHDGTPVIGGCRVDDLAAQFGTRSCWSTRPHCVAVRGTI